MPWRAVEDDVRTRKTEGLRFTAQVAHGLPFTPDPLQHLPSALTRHGLGLSYYPFPSGCHPAAAEGFGGRTLAHREFRGVALHAVDRGEPSSSTFCASERCAGADRCRVVGFPADLGFIPAFEEELSGSVLADDALYSVASM